MPTKDDEIMDRMLDEISRCRDQAKSWEQLCHLLANCLLKKEDATDVLVTYSRAVRSKYRRASNDQ